MNWPFLTCGTTDTTMVTAKKKSAPGLEIRPQAMDNDRAELHLTSDGIPAGQYDQAVGSTLAAPSREAPPGFSWLSRSKNSFL